MKISQKWLEKYLTFDKSITPDRFRREFSRCVAEVESYEIQGISFENIVVGRVKKIMDHPNADSLRLCTVDIGTDKVQIICGGTNLQKDMYVAVALPGSRVRWHGEGEPVLLNKSVIRGEESFGMICASDEIGLVDRFPAGSKKEILDLGCLGMPLDVGVSLREVFGQTDIIYEIENKTLSNRPDLWGHYGIAREVAAVFSTPLGRIDEFKIVEGDKAFTVDVADFFECTRYSGVLLENVTIKESPDWLKNALSSVGVRSINAVVDVTNYVMLELGQPLHAFDADTLKDETIVVRRAESGEKLLLLDNKIIDLDKDTLVIADSEKPVALAGIMGGKETEVNFGTKSVFLECANFNPGLIRKISTRLGLRTEASMRFEKSLDPYGTYPALARAVSLLQELNPELIVASLVIDAYDKLPNPVLIEISYDKVTRFLGSPMITREFIHEKLISLGFTFIEENDDSFTVQVPSWRATKDITIAEDVIGEIIRLFGYDAVSSSEPRTLMNIPPCNRHKEVESLVKDYCSLSLGMNETYGYSFISPRIEERLGSNIDDFLRLENPIAKDTPLLRRRLLDNLLDAAGRNSRFDEHFSLYEIGRIFRSEPGVFPTDFSGEAYLPDQPYSFGAVFVPGNNNEAPFYDAKYALDKLLKYLHISYELIPVKKSELESWMHPLRTVFIDILHERVGVLGEIHPLVAKSFNLSRRVSVFEIAFDSIVKLARLNTVYIPIPKYPSVTLDVSLVVDERVTWEMVRSCVFDREDETVSGCELFDVFVNDSLREAGKKSMAFRITYQREDRTLEQSEVQLIHDGILSDLQKTLKSSLRS